MSVHAHLLVRAQVFVVRHRHGQPVGGRRASECQPPRRAGVRLGAYRAPVRSQEHLYPRPCSRSAADERGARAYDLNPSDA